MSYYDHATLMALKLGPWADPQAVEREFQWLGHAAGAEIISRPPTRFGRRLFARLWPRRKRPSAKPEQRPEPA